MHSFDGHNDVLLRLWHQGNDGVATFLEGDGKGQLDLLRAREGGMVGGLYAIFVPSEDKSQANEPIEPGTYDIPMPPALELTHPQPATLEMASLLFRIAESSRGRVRLARSVADIRAAKAAGAHAPVLHIEGCEALDGDLRMLDVLYAAGLRTLGPVWSRPNIFGHGVPFRFPSSPDTGEGLTDVGRALVRRCNEMRVLIDVSHLNEQGFWDVARLSSAPLVATHACVHAICSSTRNLTDKQLDAIRESDGVVGVNFSVNDVRPDARNNADTPLHMLTRHFHYLVDRIGIDRVAIGSDFDGATIPAAIKDASGLPNLIAALRASGFDEQSLRKIAYDNWMRVFRLTWRQ